MMSRTLVAYFSATGTTARVAKSLAAAIGADTFEIVPERAYTRADLNWNDRNSRSSREMNDDAARPAFVGDVPAMGQYDTVFVGYPVWWGIEPRIVDTFLEAHDLSGKTVVPFATSGGSGLGRAPRRMQSLARGATVVEGRLLNGHQGADALRAWASGLGKRSSR